MQIVKQLNPINTTIYIEFDMIIDVDFGLLRYVGLEFADDRIFYTEIFENDDNVIKGLLMEREKYNPLTVPAIDEEDSELLNKLYDEFFEKYKNEIINCSDITSLLEWVVKMLHANSGIRVIILCKDKLEKSGIDDIMDKCETNNYESIIVNIEGDNQIDITEADVLVTKYSKNLFYYDNLDGKTIYLADIMCNADLDILEKTDTKYPNIDAVLYCENNEFKFITMYPYDDSYSINGEFDITTNDPSYYEDEEENNVDDQSYYDDEDINYGDIKLLEQWLSPEDIEKAKEEYLKAKNNNQEEDDDDNDEIKVVDYNPLKDK